MTFAFASAHGQTTEQLQRQVEQLQRQLAQTQRQLAAARAEGTSTADVAEMEETIANAADLGPSKITPGDLIPALEGLEIGGAIRANYVIGDYPNGSAPSRGGDGGNFGLDTFRINADYTRGDYVAKFEYRWYNGYNMLHTGWFGYNFEDESQVQVGVNRVPFGPGAYGVSQSWLFDQHYYVGLSDDMDLGVKYTTKLGDVSVDLGYYFSDEGQWRGGSRDSARYSYDVVDETDNGYEERNQFNARIVKPIEFGEITGDLGLSAQYGMLKSNGAQDDGNHYAASGHAVFKMGNWTLTPQLTYYNYDIDDHQVQSGVITDQLIDMGAYDFAWDIAAEAWIPAISLSYYQETASVDWLDYVIPYIEYSSIVKTESDFNDSELFILGAAWGRGGWYIYTDLGFSNGNYFVGGDDFTTFGANPNDEWQTRFNINFGYYF
ncbi:MAG: hypothetical protein GVY36_09440 [Verrucomicrobia bacterium]|nr:hypothetical protein [Verrucomicrobiota bacterium]